MERVVPLLQLLLRGGDVYSADEADEAETVSHDSVTSAGWCGCVHAHGDSIFQGWCEVCPLCFFIRSDEGLTLERSAP